VLYLIYNVQPLKNNIEIQEILKPKPCLVIIIIIIIFVCGKLVNILFQKVNNHIVKKITWCRIGMTISWKHYWNISPSVKKSFPLFEIDNFSWKDWFYKVATKCMRLTYSFIRLNEFTPFLRLFEWLCD